MSDKIKVFTMPKWGIEMEEGVIREWHANIGDKISKGDLLVVIETEKIANEVELEYDGVLRHRVGNTGDTLPVGAMLAVFADPSVSDEDVTSAVESFKGVDASFAGSAISTATEPPSQGASQNTSEKYDTLISPMAERLLRELNIDHSVLQGSGRGGRISLQDVQQYAKSNELLAEVSESPLRPRISTIQHPNYDGNPHKVVKLSGMRKAIARRLSEANQTIPHFYLRAKINMDALTAQRRDNKQGTVNDYLIRACAIALKAEPDVNVQFAGDSIHQFEHADISVAVATERGLITPIIRNADTKTVSQISTEMKKLVEKANAETLKLDEFQGGTFSISNMGMMGIYNFDAVINPPMAAILAVGATEKTVLPGGKEARLMHVTLCCDHRAVDGALGARWLMAFRKAVEDPQQLM